MIKPTKIKSLTATVIILFTFNNIYGQLKSESRLNYDYHTIDSVITNRWESQALKSKDFPNTFIPAFQNDPVMFYWDTFFINKGLIATGKLQLAKENTLNILDIVDRFGYMPNAAITTWGMNRSQPPYLSVMVRDIFKAEKDIKFLAYAYPILKKEYEFWTGQGPGTIENHQTKIKGLQRFSHHASKQELIDLYKEVAKRLGFDKNINDEQKCIIASRYAAEAETGMDFTMRFEGNCPDFIAVDLNCLLYCLERNMDWISKQLNPNAKSEWSRLAQARRVLINRYCWEEKTGMYYDFNYVTLKRSKVAAVTTLQPLWAGIASANQAKRVMTNLRNFETPYGLTTTIAGSKDENYQWGCLSVWAPMQLIAVDGLLNYGYKKEAKIIADKYMLLIAKNYELPVSSKKDSPAKRLPGFTYEKYKLDGTINDDEYTAHKMMGWTAGVYNYLYHLHL